MRSTIFGGLGWLLVLGGLGACLSKSTGDTGGETHWQKGWLAGCVSSADCEAGLTCLGHLCTTTCESDSECEQGESAACQDVGGENACVTPERIGCSSATLTCDSAHAGWTCNYGPASGCAQPISVCDGTGWQAGTFDTCRDRVATLHASDAGATIVIGDRRPPIDVLVVMDNMGGMADVQRSFAKAVGPFLTRLADATGADVRLAATSVDVQCEDDGGTQFATRGRFNSVAAQQYAPTAMRAFRTVCSTDEECAAAACDATGQCDTSADNWDCRSTPSESCQTNPNGSINTTCRRLCTSDDECRALYGDEAYCQHPSGQPQDWGCNVAPPTQACPSIVPEVVSDDEPELAACVVSLVENSSKCMKFAQGLEASRLALDRQGRNEAQAKAFQRDGLLVVIYVSNGDDCSTQGTLPEEQYATCALQGSTDEGGPLVPVREYIDFLGAQRPSGRVVVMSISGQSLETEPEAIDADIAAYVASAGSPKTCYHSTTLCEGPLGPATHGARYAELALAFGSDGEVVNLCGSADASEFLARLETRVLTNVRRACAPRLPLNGFTVTLVSAGVERVLVEGPGEDGYAMTVDAPECNTGAAIIPNRTLAPGDRIVIGVP